MALLSPPPKHQFFGDDGLPLSGGLVYTYEKDTTVPLATYTDSTGSVANANPIVLDGQGRASVWFQILPYSLVIYNSLGELQSCSGPIEFPPAATSGSDIAAWSDIVVYNFPDLVAGSDGYTYRCVGTNNLDDDPVTSTSGDWVNLSSVASPNLTGTPTAPTAPHGTNTTQIATTAFVQAVKGIKNWISGGDITVSGNTLTITPCACWDSTRLIWLETTANKTVTIPSAASTLYHIFQVRLVADSSVEFRAYTALTGTGSPEDDAEIDAYRRLDYWWTNSSNAARAGFTVNGVKWWSRFSENALAALALPPAGITTTIDLSSFIPDDFYDEVLFGAQGTDVTWCQAFIGSVSGSVIATLTGVNNSAAAGEQYEWGYPTLQDNRFVPIVGNQVYWGRGTQANSGQTVALAIHSVKLRR